ncbi:MAG: hypothetical protein ABSF34_18540, partial [Verrucomicrobiota bacterium]
ARNAARLRITLTAAHTAADVESLCLALHGIQPSERLALRAAETVSPAPGGEGRGEGVRQNQKRD